VTTLCFFSGLLAGAVLAVLAVGEIIKWTFRNSPAFRDRVRVWLAWADGYPFVRCPHCENFFSTAPADDEEDSEP